MEKKLFNGSACIGEGWNTKLFRRWTKYGKDRIYICREDGKKSYGYIDLDNDNCLVCDADLKSTLAPLVSEFLETYEILKKEEK